MKKYNKILIEIGWTIVVITTYLAVIGGYEQSFQRITGIIVLAGITFASYKNLKNTNVFTIIALFLLSFNVITLHQSNSITFNPFSDTITTNSIVGYFTLSFAGGNFELTYHPIYLIVLAISFYIYRKDLKRFFPKT